MAAPVGKHSMQLGDHVLVRRPVFGRHGHFYTHHGIYVGGELLIHYAGYANGFSSSEADRQVALVHLRDFCADQPLQVRDHRSQFSRAAVAQRARSRLGEDRYNLLWRNCEHFATWCWTGEERSRQVRTVFKAGAALTLMLGACAFIRR